jgi:hypothetical protein
MPFPINVLIVEGSGKMNSFPLMLSAAVYFSQMHNIHKSQEWYFRQTLLQTHCFRTLQYVSVLLIQLYHREPTLKYRSSLCRSSHREACRSSNEHNATEFHGDQKGMFFRDQR